MVQHGGRGSAGIQGELQLHRVQPGRPGHGEFLEACNAPEQRKRGITFQQIVLSLLFLWWWFD